MKTIKTVTEETRLSCVDCQGDGRVWGPVTWNQDGSGASALAAQCRACKGRGSYVTTTITRTEEVDLDELIEAIGQRMNKLP